MSLVEEALHGIRGAVRIIRRDPNAFENFNLTIEGFWRSFAAILPAAVLVWPQFVSSNLFMQESAVANGDPLPDSNLAGDYFHLGLAFAAWPVVAAILARVLGVSQNFVRYVIASNWMSVPILLISLIPHALYLAGMLSWQGLGLAWMALFVGFAYLSWYVALRGLQTTPLIAFGFMLAEYAVSLGLSELIG